MKLLDIDEFAEFYRQEVLPSLIRISKDLGFYPNLNKLIAFDYPYIIEDSFKKVSEEISPYYIFSFNRYTYISYAALFSKRHMAQMASGHILSLLILNNIKFKEAFDKISEEIFDGHRLEKLKYEVITFFKLFGE